MEEFKDTIMVQDIKDILIPYFSEYECVKILNVGAKAGNKPEFNWISDLGKKSEEFCLEYDLNYVSNTEHSFYGDICSCPGVGDNLFDIVFINNVLEHTLEPWAAAQECIRICKPGGVIIVGTPFAWYYHKHPVDFWRFSHEGLKHLFERNGGVEALCYGFKEHLWNDKKRMPKAKGIQSLYVCKKK